LVAAHNYCDAMDTREEIREIARRLEAGEVITDVEFASFMQQHRDYLMQIATPVRSSEQLSENRYYPCTTCSCGSAEQTSCDECYSWDGNKNNTSMFAVSITGDVIRYEKPKDTTNHDE
jgi:hypothetical protein